MVKSVCWQDENITMMYFKIVTSDSLGTVPWHYSYKKNRHIRKITTVFLKFIFLGKG